MNRRLFECLKLKSSILSIQVAILLKWKRKGDLDVIAHRKVAAESRSRKKSYYELVQRQTQKVITVKNRGVVANLRKDIP